MPKLPAPHQRWTVRRKAAVVEAVRGGWLPIEDVCQLYNISVDEFLAWERDIDRYGLHGLRVTRYQIYRDTERAARIAEHDPQIHGRKACLVKLACDGIALATPGGRRRRAIQPPQMPFWKSLRRRRKRWLRAEGERTFVQAIR